MVELKPRDQRQASADEVISGLRGKLIHDLGAYSGSGAGQPDLIVSHMLSAYVMPALCAAATFAVLIFAWTQHGSGVQSAILSIGWPVLYLVTVLQTVFMVKKLVRRQRGFTV